MHLKWGSVPTSCISLIFYFFFNGKDIEYDFKSRWKRDIVSLTCALYRLVIEFSPWWCHPVPKHMISQDMNKPITHLCQKKGKQPTGRYLFFVFLFTFEGNLFFLIQDEISLFLFLFPSIPPFFFSPVVIPFYCCFNYWFVNWMLLEIAYRNIELLTSVRDSLPYTHTPSLSLSLSLSILRLSVSLLGLEKVETGARALLLVSV